MPHTDSPHAQTPLQYHTPCYTKWYQTHTKPHPPSCQTTTTWPPHHSHITTTPPLPHEHHTKTTWQPHTTADTQLPRPPHHCNHTTTTQPQHCYGHVETWHSLHRTATLTPLHSTMHHHPMTTALLLSTPLHTTTAPQLFGSGFFLDQCYILFLGKKYYWGFWKYFLSGPVLDYFCRRHMFELFGSGPFSGPVLNYLFQGKLFGSGFFSGPVLDYFSRRHLV